MRDTECRDLQEKWSSPGSAPLSHFSAPLSPGLGLHIGTTLKHICNELGRQPAVLAWPCVQPIFGDCQLLPGFHSGCSPARVQLGFVRSPGGGKCGWGCSALWGGMEWGRHLSPQGAPSVNLHLGGVPESRAAGRQWFRSSGSGTQDCCGCPWQGAVLATCVTTCQENCLDPNSHRVCIMFSSCLKRQCGNLVRVMCWFAGCFPGHAHPLRK